MMEWPLPIVSTTLKNCFGMCDKLNKYLMKKIDGMENAGQRRLTTVYETKGLQRVANAIR